MNRLGKGKPDELHSGLLMRRAMDLNTSNRLSLVLPYRDPVGALSDLMRPLWLEMCDAE